MGEERTPRWRNCRDDRHGRSGKTSFTLPPCVPHLHNIVSTALVPCLESNSITKFVDLRQKLGTMAPATRCVWVYAAVAVLALAGATNGFGVKVEPHEETCFHDDLKVCRPLELVLVHAFICVLRPTNILNTSMHSS